MDEIVLKIKQIVSKFYNVSIEELEGNSRKRTIVIARHTCIYFINVHTQYSLNSIGHMFGTRDHSTCLNSMRAIKNLLETNYEYSYEFNVIKKEIKLYLKSKTLKDYSTKTTCENIALLKTIAKGVDKKISLIDNIDLKIRKTFLKHILQKRKYKRFYN